MKRSTDRIRVSHAGVLPRPDDLQQLVAAGPGGAAEFDKRLPDAVRDVVRKQAELGIDVVNDGEYSKRSGFSSYLKERLGGWEERDASDDDALRNVTARDRLDFPGFFAKGLGGFSRRARPLFAIEPLRYTGLESVQTDIANLRAAIGGLDVEPYLPAVTPGTVEHWLFNEYYQNDEELLFAIADALHHEYQAITDAGIILQLDDPDLPDGWQMFPGMSPAEYHTYAERRIAALNHALRGIPRERVRLHVCWGSGHGPHANDVELEHIVDLVLQVPAGCISFEAANPRHEHDWRTWQAAGVPDDVLLMPGVVGHCTDIIEHPRLVADRLQRYIDLFGKERIIAGTDCGLAIRVGHAEITWAKLKALVDGARLVSQENWGG
jgi:5-methyltetrahydropteroyltriglutamate--homocysteine methyltransferase